MQITNFCVYGVDAMALLAAGEPGEPCTVNQVASACGKSISYTEQLFAKLRCAGLVRAERGRGGGYYLTRPARSITVADIVSACQRPEDDAPQPWQTRPPGEAEDADAIELLWAALDSHTRHYLDGVSLAEVTPRAA